MTIQKTPLKHTLGSRECRLLAEYRPDGLRNHSFSILKFLRILVLIDDEAFSGC